MGILHTKEANIRQHPDTIRNHPEQVVTLGDMHGNVMKLIWELIYEGEIKINQEDFIRLWELYDQLSFDKNEPHAIANSKDQLEEFKDILDKITVIPSSNIRLLGDLFADRGGNDYLTLKLLQKLHHNGLKLEIIFSNHDDFLFDNYKKILQPDEKIKIEDWEKNLEWKIRNKNDQCNSLLGLMATIKFGLAEQSEIQDIINESIIPNLKLASYALTSDGQKINLFMHAPNNFTDLEKLSKSFDLNDELNSAIDLAKLLDQLNDSFRKKLRSNELSEQTKKNLESFVWSRLKKQLNIGCINFDTYPNYLAAIIHGHTDVDPPLHDNRQINLDTNLGKFKHEHGTYLSFSVHEPTLTNILELQAHNWINQMEWLAEQDSKNYNLIIAVANTAEKVLAGYKRNLPAEEQKILALQFKNAVNSAKNLHIGTLNWKNIFNVFLFIPSIIQLISTGGNRFLFRSTPIKDDHKIKPFIKTDDSDETETRDQILTDNSI